MAGTFGIAGGDDGGVNPVEPSALEEVVDGVGGSVANAHDGAEGVSADAEVGDFAKEFKASPFLLEGIVLGIGRAIDFGFLGVEFNRLALTGGFDEVAGEFDGGAGGDLLEGVVGNGAGVDDDLEVGEGGAVAELDEADAFAVAASFDPSVGFGGLTGLGGEEVFDVASSVVHWEWSLH